MLPIFFFLLFIYLLGMVSIIAFTVIYFHVCELMSCVSPAAEAFRVVHRVFLFFCERTNALKLLCHHR